MIVSGAQSIGAEPLLLEKIFQLAGLLMFRGKNKLFKI